jgi:hypothetical protein
MPKHTFATFLVVLFAIASSASDRGGRFKFVWKCNPDVLPPQPMRTRRGGRFKLV